MMADIYADQERRSVQPKEVIAVIDALIELLEQAYDGAGNPHFPGDGSEPKTVQTARKLIAKLEGIK